MILVLAAALLTAGCGGANRRDYVNRNESLLESLPVFPRAVKAQEVSTPYVHSEGSLSTKPSGYTTTVLYRVPTGTRAASVLRFYATRLGREGWKSRAFRSGTPVVGFTRNGALVAVNAILLASVERRSDQIYEVVVDHHGAGRG